MHPRYRYILETFRHLYQIPREIEIGYGTSSEPLNIACTDTGYFDTMQPFDADGVIFKRWLDRDIPLLFAESDTAPLFTIADGRCQIHYDLLVSAFFFLSGWQEAVFHKRFLAPRYDYQDSLQCKLDIAGLPVVNYYFDLMRHALEQVYNLPPVQPRWNGADMALFLSHDIDRCTSGWKQDLAWQLRRGRLISAAGIAARRLGGPDDWFNFRRILEIESRYKATSTFFFIGRSGPVHVDAAGLKNARNKGRDEPLETFYQLPHQPAARRFSGKLENADYSLDNPAIRTAFQEIRQQGSEVAIHGSFTSHIVAERYHEEQQAFDKLLRGNRFHYLYFDRNRTPQLLDKAGMDYDSTLGFAEAPGFRNGYAHPFRPYDLQKNRPHRVAEFPLIAMDTSYRSYLNTPLSHIYPHITQLMNECQRFGGCCSILWHNNYFSDYKFSGWEAIYEALLQEGKRRSARLDSAERLLEYCRPWLIPPEPE